MRNHSAERKAPKRTTQDCIALKLPELKWLGMLQRGYMTRRSIACYEGGRNYAGTLTAVSDIECLEVRACLTIIGTVYGDSIHQHILLESLPMRFGGERWYARCPRTGKRCTTLVLPRGETQFASMAGWSVAYASQGFSPLRRIDHALSKAEDRLTLHPPAIAQSTLAQMIAGSR